MADRSHTIRKLDEVIQYMVNYDDLTGLHNRVLFRDRPQQALSQAQGNNHLFKETGLIANYLELELTESIIIENVQQTITISVFSRVEIPIVLDPRQHDGRKRNPKTPPHLTPDQETYYPLHNKALAQMCD